MRRGFPMGAGDDESIIGNVARLGEPPPGRRRTLRALALSAGVRGFARPCGTPSKRLFPRRLPIPRPVNLGNDRARGEAAGWM